MQNLSKLLGQGLLPLQVLRGGVRGAGEGLQKAAQSVLCRQSTAVTPVPGGESEARGSAAGLQWQCNEGAGEGSPSRRENS